MNDSDRSEFGPRFTDDDKSAADQRARPGDLDAPAGHGDFGETNYDDTAVVRRGLDLSAREPGIDGPPIDSPGEAAADRSIESSAGPSGQHSPPSAPDPGGLELGPADVAGPPPAPGPVSGAIAVEQVGKDTGSPALQVPTGVSAPTVVWGLVLVALAVLGLVDAVTNWRLDPVLTAALVAGVAGVLLVLTAGISGLRATKQR